MVRHIILWKLKDSFTEEEKKNARAQAKSRLEFLNGKIDGLVSLKVVTDRLDSSSADIHLEAAGYVRSVVAERLCLDF